MPDITFACPHCGSELSVGTVFCIHCGTDLRSGKQVKLNSPSGRSNALVKTLMIAIPAVVLMATALVGGSVYQKHHRRVSFHRKMHEAYTSIMASAEFVSEIPSAIKDLKVLRYSATSFDDHSWMSRIDDAIVQLEDRKVQQDAAQRAKEEKRRLALAREEEKRRLALARQEEAQKRAQEELLKTETKKAKSQKQVSEAYSHYLNNFRSPLGRLSILQLLNGNEITGEIAAVNSNMVQVKNGKANITLYRDELRLASWLQCSGEDYARYHANKQLGRPQEEYIQAMISKQDHYEEEKKDRELAKKEEASKYEIVYEKVKCPSCGGTGYKAGLRRADGSTSKRMCIRCRGNKYTTKAKTVLKEPDRAVVASAYRKPSAKRATSRYHEGLSKEKLGSGRLISQTYTDIRRTLGTGSLETYPNGIKHSEHELHGLHVGVVYDGIKSGFVRIMSKSGAFTQEDVAAIGQANAGTSHWMSNGPSDWVLAGIRQVHMTVEKKEIRLWTPQGTRAWKTGTDSWVELRMRQLNSRSSNSDGTRNHERRSDISPSRTTPPKWQVSEGPPQENGVRTINENQYLAKHYGRDGGAFETVEAAARKARLLNQQQTYNMDAAQEMAMSGGGGSYVLNMRVGRWTYGYDADIRKFVVFQK